MAAHDDDDERKKGVSRRGFLQRTGLGLAAAGLTHPAATALAAAPAIAPHIVGPGPVRITLQVNGRAHALSVEPRATLADVLRNELGLTGTKIGCDRGACSACTVHLDGNPVASCLVLAVEVGARRVTTIEGLAHGETLLPVQREFIAHDAMQCGFCTPGMVMSCAALLAKSHRPTEDEVKSAISGNLCRCGTYPKVVAATLAAAGRPLDDTAHPRFASEAVRESGAEIPKDAPPPWPDREKLAVVGRETPRLDGRAKVTGAAKYTSDIQLPGMLYARRVASPHAHARVKSIDTSKAERLPGVRAVHVVKHNREGARAHDESGPYPTVRYAGQTIAAVAATSQAIADEAARLVEVEYDLLQFTVDLDEARKEGAPLVYRGPTEQAGTAGGGGAAKALPQKGNVRGPNESAHGDVEAGLRAAEIVVEGTFRTQVQTHSALEPHGVVADWRPDGLTVWASTQGTSTVRDELAEVFDLPRAKVRVIAEYIGGGFGAKFGAGSYGVLATRLSKAAGAPVRLVLDRHEEHTCVGNRPSSEQTLKIGAKRDGELVAIALESWGTAGVGLGAGVGRVAEQLYPAKNFRSLQYDVFTHAAPGCAFRAPGHPQGTFAVEQLIDELAERLQIDPLALRDRLDGGDDKSDRAARRIERRVGAERVGWAKRPPVGSDRGPRKRGLGMAQAIWGRYVELTASCEVLVHPDGSVELRSAVQDIGTGTRTALAQIVAEELGIRPSDVIVRIGDTQYPRGPNSGGSKTLLSITPAVRIAAYAARTQLVEAAAPSLSAKPDEIDLREGHLFVRGAPSRSLPFKRACAKLRGDGVRAQGTRPTDYGGDPHDRYGGVQFAEVVVDVETGVVKVERVVAVHDCGRVVNPLAVQSQVNGGILHGLSYALYEERRLDPLTGRMVNANFEQYKIAGPREAPKIEVILVDEYLGRTATDANGIGEPANIATAAAIANAVYHATGARVRQLPITPPVVLAALARKEGRR